VGNGPTEEDAEIIQHDQLSTHSEEGEEVSARPSPLSGQHAGSQSAGFWTAFTDFHAGLNYIATFSVKSFHSSFHTGYLLVIPRTPETAV